MKVIRRLGERLLSSTISSNEKLLRKILSRKEFTTLMSACQDKRVLLKECALMFRLSETQLAMEIARRNKAAFIADPPAIDPSVLPADITISELRTKGVIPLIVESRLAGLACSDLASHEGLKAKLGDLPLVMSLWDSIALALDRSEEFLQNQQRQGLKQSTQRKVLLVTRVLEAVIREALSHKARKIKIALEEAQIVYSFELKERRTASGFIDLSIRRELFEYLKELAGKTGCALTVGDDEHNYEVRFETSKEVAFINLAGSIEEKKAIIPLRAVTKGTSLAGEAEVENTTPREKSGKKEKPVVFIVDDNQTFLKVLERFFSRQEVNTLHANDGESALKMLRSGECIPDVIVSDVHMPQMNGFEFIKKLKQHDELKDIPVVMLTSDSDVETELRLIEEGIDVFITKNQDPRLLCAQVNRLIAKRNSFAA